MPEVTHYLWMDLETTGVDEKLDQILEVGFILTDKDLVEKSYGSSVIQITEWGWRRLRNNEFVLNMHKENGLVGDLERQNGDFPTVNEYEEFLLDMLGEAGIESHKVMLAGSGVGHFDRRFIAHWMMALNKFLAYPVIDVGIVRRFYSDICGEEVSAINEGKTHRALDDIRCHLEEARWFKERFTR